MNPISSRNIQLDILRGIAILLVIGRHVELPRPGGLAGEFAYRWYQIGWIGVDLFFVLSGFLIGGLLIKEFAKNGRIRISRFLIRRGLKIYPLYFLFIAYVILWPAVKALKSGGELFPTFTSQWSLYWPNLLFLQNYIGTNPAGHTWTLAVEEHFYLILPFALVTLIATKRIRWLIPICILMVPVFLGFRCFSVYIDNPYAVSMAATHLRLEALLFGVGLRGIAEMHPARFAAFRRWRLPLLIFGLACWFPNFILDPSTVFVRTLGLTGTLLGSAAFLVATLHTHASDFAGSRKLVTSAARVVSWIGVFSYGIYLWHVTTIGILERVISDRILTTPGEVTTMEWLLITTLVTIGVIASGAFISRVIEWPVLRFRDRFFPSLSGPTDAIGGSRTSSGERHPEPTAQAPTRGTTPGI
ncbi:MAG: acyltransferase [Opitutaceae bacterium]